MKINNKDDIYLYIYCNHNSDDFDAGWMHLLWAPSICQKEEQPFVWFLFFFDILPFLCPLFILSYVVFSSLFRTLHTVSSVET